MNPSTDADIAASRAIGALSAILKVVADTTGMRFACVTRVTSDSWTACAVLGRLSVGPHPGGRLDVGVLISAPASAPRRRARR